ncbi:hypothetical protein EDB86DRAFT_2958337 [Lactarius hatsudake]|nr:hypothetical protein EDB86DRAFT_2958337 [Lactarius hatsudake]
MSHFNDPFIIPNPDTFPALDVPASVEDLDNSTMHSINNSTFDFSFLYDGGTSPYNTTGFESKGDSFATVATGEISTDSAFGGLTTIDATTLASAPAPPPLPDYGVNLHDFGPLSELIDWDFSASPTPSLSNASSNPSPPKDGIGDWIDSPHVREALTSTFASLPDLPSELGIPGNFQEELTPAPSGGGVGSTPQTQCDEGAFTPAGMFENMSHLSSWNHADTNLNVPALINLLMTTTATTATTIAGDAGGVETVLEEWARSDGSGLPQKRGRPTSWVLEEAEGSRKRTHHTPAARAQQQIIKCIHDSTTRSGEARTITEQGLHPHLLRGPSTSQETVGSPGQEHLERGAQLETQHDARGIVPQQIDLHTGGSAEGRKDFYAIPSKLTKRQRMMLRTTEDDEKRKAVRVIKCKLCPKREMNSWECFRRHCNTSEEHPAKLTFCGRCGDHFARPDSKKRHEGKKLQEECHATPPHDANRKKERIIRLLKDFNVELERRLSNGEEPGPHFPVIAREYVLTTSKKEYRRTTS